MDPDASLRDLLEAMEAGDCDQVSELADALANWMSRGGFPPQTIGPSTLGIEWHAAVTTALLKLAKVHVEVIASRCEPH